MVISSISKNHNTVNFGGRIIESLELYLHRDFFLIHEYNLWDPGHK